MAHLAQAARGRDPPGARRGAAWKRGGPPPALLRASGVFRDKRFLGFFLEFSEHFDFLCFSAMLGQKQTKTSTGHSISRLVQNVLL